MDNEKLINTYTELMKTKVNSKQKYVILAYFLHEKFEDKYGKYIFLGAEPNKELAIKKAKELYMKTKHPGIIACKSGRWYDFKVYPNLDETVWISENHEEELKEQAKKERQELEKKIEEKNKKFENINKELIAESGDTIDNYIQNWYQLVITYLKMDKMEKQLKDIQKYFEECKANITKIRGIHREYDDILLEKFKEDLSKNEEESKFPIFEMGINHLKNVIFNNNTDKNISVVGNGFMKVEVKNSN